MPPVAPIARPVAVLGSGVSGLSTALVLTQRGCEVVIYSDADAAPPASVVAPAMFTPYSPADSPAFIARTNFSFATFSMLASLDDRDSPATGVRLAELREYVYAPTPSCPWLDSLLNTRPLPTPPPPFPQSGRAITSLRPHIDMDRYLPWLRTQLTAAGARFETLRVPSFDAVFGRGHSTIINCTGVGSRLLARDPLLRPMHGQVLHVPNDIGLTYSLHDDAPGGRVAYIFNFGDHLILGGTFDIGREDPDPDEPALSAIIDRCRALLRLDGHPRWVDLARTRLAARAAPRPSRGRGDTYEDIRLERESLPGGRTLIHNYGHGRTGVTLSWGCAAEAADLLIGGDTDSA